MTGPPDQFHTVESDPEVRALVGAADDRLRVLGLNEHGFAHVRRVEAVAATILRELGFDDQAQEQARIAALLHDIGNAVSRRHHATTGALLAHTILSRLNVPPLDISVIIGAIGSHGDDHGIPGVATDPVSAALILADKADVHRSRIRERDATSLDLHDRVGFSVMSSRIIVDHDARVLRFEIVQDAGIASAREFRDLFSIQLAMCDQAAKMLDHPLILGISEVADR